MDENGRRQGLDPTLDRASGPGRPLSWAVTEALAPLVLGLQVERYEDERAGVEIEEVFTSQPDWSTPMAQNMLDAEAEVDGRTLRVADQAHDEALRTSTQVANAEMARTEATRAATVARADAIRDARVARADALRRISVDYDQGLRRAETARRAALQEAETAYGIALQGAETQAAQAVERAHQDELAAAQRAHEEALRVAEGAAESAIGRAEAIRDAGIAWAEAIRASGENRVLLTREADSRYEDALTKADRARAVALARCAIEHDEALRAATSAYDFAFRSPG